MRGRASCSKRKDPMIAQKRPLEIAPRRSNRFRIAFWAAIGFTVLATTWSFDRHEGISVKPALRKDVLSRASTVRARPTKAVQTVAANKTTSAIDPKGRPHPAYDKKTNSALPPKKYIPTVEEVENARLGSDGRPRPMSIYKTPAEQALGLIFTTELGSPPPVLPNIPQCTSQEDLNEFLSRTFESGKDATEAVIENRMIMDRVKKELKTYLDEGGDIGGFIDFYVGELRASHEQWKTAQTMLVDMARSSEDAESLRSFRDAANKLLAEKGIKPLTVPPSVRRAMGEE